MQKFNEETLSNIIDSYMYYYIEQDVLDFDFFLKELKSSIGNDKLKFQTFVISKSHLYLSFNINETNYILTISSDISNVTKQDKKNRPEVNYFWNFTACLINLTTKEIVVHSASYEC